MGLLGGIRFIQSHEARTPVMGLVSLEEEETPELTVSAHIHQGKAI